MFGFEKHTSDITYQTLLNLNLVGEKYSSELRSKVSSRLNIGNPNAKTFLKRVNALGLSSNDLKKLVGDVNEK